LPVTPDQATDPALPEVFWFSVGISAATMARNVGAPAEPLGAARKVFCVCEASAAVSVPEPVTGDPDTLNRAGRDRPTLVTVPVLAVAPVATPSNLVLSAELMKPATEVVALPWAVPVAPTWDEGAASVIPNPDSVVGLLVIPDHATLVAVAALPVHEAAEPVMFPFRLEV
jgi:hypothetical protein